MIPVAHVLAAGVRQSGWRQVATWTPYPDRPDLVCSIDQNRIGDIVHTRVLSPTGGLAGAVIPTGSHGSPFVPWAAGFKPPAAMLHDNRFWGVQQVGANPGNGLLKSYGEAGVLAHPSQFRFAMTLHTAMNRVWLYATSWPTDDPWPLVYPGVPTV